MPPRLIFLFSRSPQIPLTKPMGDLAHDRIQDDPLHPRPRRRLHLVLRRRLRFADAKTDKDIEERFKAADKDHDGS